MKKSIDPANAVTASRVVFAALILFVPAFSAAFYACYLLGALSDVADGIVARALRRQSPFGAALDTVADLLFVAAVLLKIVGSVAVPRWLWLWAALIALIKGVNLLSGFVVCRGFAAVHSVLNKVTGCLLFVLPLAVGVGLPQRALDALCVLACSVATVAAVQEGHYIRTGRIVE